MRHLSRSSFRDAFTPARHPSGEGRNLRLVDGAVVAARIEVASSPLRRARGLIGRKAPSHGSALVLHPCKQVHTIGMRFGIDAVFCDAALEVIAVETLRPGRISKLYRRADWCFELPEGVAASAGVVPGSRLHIER